MTASETLVLWSGDPAEAGEWHANAADGSTARLAPEAGPGGTALRLDFSLGGHGSWVIARRTLAATLPAHYVAVLELRGSAAPTELQFKFVDPSGANVWWWRQRGFTPAPDGRRVVLRRARLEFAWGPLSGGDPKQIGAVELALASDTGGAGTLCIDRLSIEARDPDAAQPSVCGARASSCAPAHEPERALAADAQTCWRPDPGDTQPWIDLDLGRRCEFGGVVVDFAGAAPACKLLASDDGSAWTPLAEASAGSARRCWLRTADGEGRFARLAFAAGSAPAVVHADVVPLELAVSPARYVTAAAHRAPRGRYPRHLLGEQAYWAVVGADGDERKGLLSEDGALEVDLESFSLEPFLWAGGRLFSWADVERRAELATGCLPVPTVEWKAAGFALRITAAATGPAGSSTLVARYTVENTGAAPQPMRLFVAVRPFQVTPAWQSLNLVGGVAPLTRIACTSVAARLNDARSVVSVTPPTVVGAAGSEDGLAALATGDAPAATAVEDPVGFAHAVFAFDLTVAPRAASTVALAVPLHPTAPPPPHGLDHDTAAAWADARVAEVVAVWQARLAGVPIELPPSAQRFAATLHASLAWILVNREGPRIQPGPRTYRRSWIRDGTLTGTALAEMGFADEARAFLRWYAPFQFPDGRVPCAIDHRGIDLAVEHDSHGQLAWGVVEVYRLTGDRTFLRELWPHVLRAVDAIEALRTQRTGDAFRGDARFGLLPESISHEGYASHPVHAYWDDFFAVLGLASAADAAALLGDNAAAQRIGALRDAMRADLHESIRRTIETHHLDVLPGSVELGDFDPTSSAIALDPCGEYPRLPPAVLAQTFERYWAEFDARRRGDRPAEAYTPYEVRTAAALVMLGHRDRAAQLLEWLIADQRPPAWCQWPEIAWREPREPRFLGDLPHGWVASSFVRAVRRMLVYERADAPALVLAAGVPAAWVREAPGVRVRGLPTHFGRLDFTLCAESDSRIRGRVGGDLRCPTGGIEIVSPFERPLRALRVDGRALPAVEPGRVVLHALPADIILDY